MKISVPLTACLVISGGLAANCQNPSLPSSAMPAVAANYGKLPLGFQANQGQTDPQVRFTSRSGGYSLFLTDKEAVLALGKIAGSQTPGTNSASGGRPGANPFAGASSKITARPKPAKTEMAEFTRTDVVRMQLAGARPGLAVTGEDKLPGTSNYFIGSDPAKWHSNVPTYAKVRYSGVYPGIDLVYYGNQERLEYDFVVAPGADPAKVKLHFAGAERLHLNANGDLTLIAKNGEVVFHKPVVYQVRPVSESHSQPVSGSVVQQVGERQPVQGRFSLLAGNTVGFELGEYDKSRAVVIDPTLEYSTYLGGSGGGDYGYPSDRAYGVTVDTAGNAYVIGVASSTDFPVTEGAFQPVQHSSSYNVFVAKLNGSGTALIYSTYLGGTSFDIGAAIAADASGDAYVTGSTYSRDFPVTPGAFQTVNKARKHSGTGSSVFVTKLNPEGTGLIYSTLLGGGGDLVQGGGGSHGDSITVNSTGDAYVAGDTTSFDFPASRYAFQSVNNTKLSGGYNGFITKFNREGTGLIWSTYLGGSGTDSVRAIAVDSASHAYVTGLTQSKNFPATKGAYQTRNKEAGKYGENIFVTKLNRSGSGLLYSTYVGGTSGLTSPSSIALDPIGHAYVTGETTSDDYPVTDDAFQTVNKASGPVNGVDDNAFVTKLNVDGTFLLYSTYLGGSQYTEGAGIAVDASGNAFVAGVTGASDFPVTEGAFQTTTKAGTPDNNGIYTTNAFITELNPEGSALLYSTYLGGTPPTYEGVPIEGDGATAIALDTSGNPYIAGYATSLDFPITRNALQSANHTTVPGGYNAFITHFVQAAPRTTTGPTSNPNP